MFRKKCVARRKSFRSFSHCFKSSSRARSLNEVNGVKWFSSFSFCDDVFFLCVQIKLFFEDFLDELFLIEWKKEYVFGDKMRVFVVVISMGRQFLLWVSRMNNFVIEKRFLCLKNYVCWYYETKIKNFSLKLPKKILFLRFSRKV